MEKYTVAYFIEWVDNGKLYKHEASGQELAIYYAKRLLKYADKGICCINIYEVRKIENWWED